MKDPHDIRKTAIEDEIIARSEKDAPPSVAGRMEMTHADFQRACLVAIRDYQEEPTNTFLVSLFCEAVRCSRECCDIATIRADAQRITTLLAVIEQCEKALALVEFSFKDETGFMSARGQIFQNKITNALTAIKRVKE